MRPGTADAPGQMTSPGLSEMFAYHATTMANTIKTSLVVFSRKVCSAEALLAPVLVVRVSHANQEMAYVCMPDRGLLVVRQQCQTVAALLLVVYTDALF